MTDAPEFKWVSDLADVKVGKENEEYNDEKNEIFSGKDLSILENWDTNIHGRAPITILGTRTFQRTRRHRRNDGGMTKWSPYGVQEVFEYQRRNLTRPLFTKKTVGEHYYDYPYLPFSLNSKIEY